MPQKRKRDSKDAADKRTLNPGNQQPPQPDDSRGGERQTGQFTGPGVPPLQKK
jgi:hypothetical protein